jgi:hypothetical protein
MLRRYLLNPEEPPDADSLIALRCNWVLRRLHDVGWVVFHFVLFVVLLAALGVALLMLGSVAALVVLVIRLVAAAFSEPMPSLTNVLVALPSVAASIIGWFARHKIIAGANWLSGKHPVLAKILAKSSTSSTSAHTAPREENGHSTSKDINEQSPAEGISQSQRN